MTKLKIKVKLHSIGEREQSPPTIIKKGDWVDLRAFGDVYLEEGNFGILSLGVSMKLPEGFEAVIVPRSSTFKKYGLLQTNSMGVIDNSYSGDNDIWGFPFLAMRDVNIKDATRICQFRIQPTQKATVWQKLKWLFSSGIKIIYVDSLDENDRGGFGSTGTTRFLN